MTGPEATIEKYLKARIEAIGGMCIKWTSPGFRGVPDRIVIYPSVGVVFVELKSPTGKLSDRQKRVKNMLAKAGALVFSLNGTDGVDEFVDFITGTDDVDIEDLSNLPRVH